MSPRRNNLAGNGGTRDSVSLARPSIVRITPTSIYLCQPRSRSRACVFTFPVFCNLPRQMIQATAPLTAVGSNRGNGMTAEVHRGWVTTQRVASSVLVDGESCRRLATFPIFAGIVVVANFVAARSSQNAVADASYHETIKFHCAGDRWRRCPLRIMVVTDCALYRWAINLTPNAPVAPILESRQHPNRWLSGWTAIENEHYYTRVCTGELKQ